MLSSGSVGGVFRYGDRVASIEEMCIFLLAFVRGSQLIFAKGSPHLI